jgi:hypothetical protein
VDSVILEMATFKNVSAREDAEAFLQILESAGGVFVPEKINDKSACDPVGFDTFLQGWVRGSLLSLERRQPYEVSIVFTNPEKVFEEMFRVPPDKFGLRGVAGARHFFLAVDAEYFNPSERVNELLEIGNQMYELLSPCCGFLSLPWMPRPKGSALPERGLPGWGWATWLGPEYKEFLALPSLEDVRVRVLRDGGRLICLPLPAEPDRPDPICLAAYWRLVRHIDPRLLQPDAREALAEAARAADRASLLEGPMGFLAQTRDALVPQFRFRETPTRPSPD